MARRGQPPHAAAQRTVPTSAGWGEGDRRDFIKLNAGAARECEAAPRDLEKAWGRGGSQGTRGVKLFDRDFRLLTGRILDLIYEGKLDQDVKAIVLQACAALLALDRVPHWPDGHVEDIRNLREHLQPNGYWEDYPNMPEDDGDEMP